MRNFSRLALVLGLGITIALGGCASTQNPTQQAPGFLPDYSLLKPADDAPDGTQIYTYKNPNVDRSDYHAAIIEPVTLYQKAGESGSNVTDDQIQEARSSIDKGMTKIVSKRLKITNKPGSGVLVLNVAITGATLEKESFKPWNVIPISAAIYMAKKATDLDSKQPVMVVELKFTDSRSGELLKEVVTTINGDKFRTSSSTAGEFTKLANKWVEQALKYSANK